MVFYIKIKIRYIYFLYKNDYLCTLKTTKKNNFMDEGEILERIKQIRNLKGIKQEYIAMQIEVSQSTYSKIEKGSQKLTFEMLQNIAQVLGISTHYFTHKEPLVVL